MKNAYKKSVGYIIGATLGSIIVLSLNWSLKTLVLLIIIHPLVWSILAYMVYKIDK